MLTRLKAICPLTTRMVVVESSRGQAATMRPILGLVIADEDGEQDTIVDYLVDDGELGIRPLFEAIFGDTSVYRVVEAPWNPSDDAQNLRDVAKDVQTRSKGLTEIQKN